MKSIKCVFSLMAVVSFFVAANAFGQWSQSGGSVIPNSTSWKVGIGTVTTPATTLDVGGDCTMRGVASLGSHVNGTHLIAAGSTGAGIWLRYTDDNAYYDSDKAMSLRVNLASGTATTAMFLSRNGGVGIGYPAPTTPAARLHIDDTAQTGVRVLLSGQEYYQEGNGSSTSGVAMLLGVNRTNNRQLWIADSAALGQQTPATVVRVHLGDTMGTIDAADTNGALRPLRLGNDGDIYVDSGAGKVGIGTLAPQTKLHVVGDVRVDGNIGAKYQDVAEWVPAAADLEPGTVVVLDAAVVNQVTSSTRAYDTTVAGVVSATPGIILGEGGLAKEKVATTGRVKVRVDATRNPIRIGDLLVTSDKPGMAMKSETIDVGGIGIHRPGTVIGKALEPLAGGEGEILVLLSLQ